MSLLGKIEEGLLSPQLADAYDALMRGGANHVYADMNQQQRAPTQPPAGFFQQMPQAQAASHRDIMASIPKGYQKNNGIPTTGGFAGGTTPEAINKAIQMTESQMGPKPDAGWITSQADQQKAAQWHQQLQANTKYITDTQAKWQQNAEDELKTNLTLEALGETL